MTRLRLLFAAVIVAFASAPVNGAFVTFNYGGPAVPVPETGGAAPPGTPYVLGNVPISVPDGMVMNSFQSVSVTFNPAHTWGADVILSLQHVESGLSIQLFNRLAVGSLPSSGGDSSGLAGPYTFSNSLTLTNPAQPKMVDNALSTGGQVASGVYRPTNNTFNGTTNGSGELIQNFDSIFGSMGSIAGTWRLQAGDGFVGDNTSISAFSFTADVSGTPAPAALWMALAGAGALGLLRRRMAKA